METIVSQWYFFVMLGIAAGIFSGALGLGSGIILIPTLVFLFNFPQKSAQGTALAVMVPMVLIGAIRYKMNPEIEMNLYIIVIIAVGAVAGAFIGTELTRHVQGNMLRKAFGIFIIIVGIKMILSSPRPIEQLPETNPLSIQTTQSTYEKEETNERK